MITLTPAAIAKAKEISDGEGLGHYNIRLQVKGGGCSGMQNDIYFEDLPPTDMDEIFEHDGIKLIVDPLSLSYVDGAEIDFVSKDYTSGFKVSNPNITAQCRCGQSYSA